MTIRWATTIRGWAMTIGGGRPIGPPAATSAPSLRHQFVGADILDVAECQAGCQFLGPAHHE